jgi:hypothetical protein
MPVRRFPRPGYDFRRERTFATEDVHGGDGSVPNSRRHHSVNAEVSIRVSRLIAIMTPARRLPPPWSVEEQAACFVVRDHNGQALAYVYTLEMP